VYIPVLGKALCLNKKKTLKKLLGRSRNIRFAELIAVANAFGFHETRSRVSHHILEHPAIPELLNLQDCGGQAKPYQVRQFLSLVEQYNLDMEETDE